MKNHSVDDSIYFPGSGVGVLQNSRGAAQLPRHFDVVTVAGQHSIHKHLPL